MFFYASQVLVRRDADESEDYVGAHPIQKMHHSRIIRSRECLI